MNISNAAECGYKTYFSRACLLLKFLMKRLVNNCPLCIDTAKIKGYIIFMRLKNGTNKKHKKLNLIRQVADGINI